MKVADLLINNMFDVNANVKIFAGGSWNENGEKVAVFSCGEMIPCGSMESRPADILSSNITYITTDDEGYIIIECDATPGQKLEISKMLTVSTAHVTKETYEQLYDDDIDSKIMPPVYSKSDPNDGEEFGLFVYIGQTCLEQTRIPEDLMRLIKLAQDNDCEILCLDSDGPKLDDMPTYEW